MRVRAVISQVIYERNFSEALPLYRATERETQKLLGADPELLVELKK